jgi:cytochrome P450
MDDQVAYFREVVEDRRRHPGDDLISALVAAEDGGERLSMDELIGTVIILIGAGHETTANLVGNGMLALLRTPEAYARLRADPDVLPAVLEEIIRYASPSPGQPRTALEPIEVGGRTIAAGQQIFPILNAANRDPRVFAAPERFDIDRPNNRDHITFTEGIHHCLGAALARIEATALFHAVATRLGPLELAADTLTWRATYVRGLTALPVRQLRPVGR